MVDKEAMYEDVGTRRTFWVPWSSLLGDSEKERWRGGRAPWEPAGACGSL